MPETLDVVIVGGGPVGLSLARALAGSGLETALVEPAAPVPRPASDAWDSRVYAVSPGCAAFLASGGAWPPPAAERVARIEAMRVYGDGPGACLTFSAYDAGLAELAFIIEGRLLLHALWDGLRESGVRVFCPAHWTALEFGPDCARLRLADGTGLTARLVVGADGGESRVRACAGIAATPADYGQLGVVANFECERAHHAVAFQWFMPEGVLALLPLPGRRVSMVWSITQARARELMALGADELGAKVEAASRGALGALRLVTPAAAFPLRLQRVARLVQPRVALIGDAAHNVHPLAGQGMNLGFRDARALARVLGTRGPQHDCGDLALLRRYERSRREDVMSLELVTDGLQKLFGHDAVWLSGVRNLGLDLVDRLPPLKNLLIRQAVA